MGGDLKLGSFLILFFLLFTSSFFLGGGGPGSSSLGMGQKEAPPMGGRLPLHDPQPAGGIRELLQLLGPSRPPPGWGGKSVPKEGKDFPLSAPATPWQRDGTPSWGQRLLSKTWPCCPPPRDCLFLLQEETKGFSAGGGWWRELPGVALQANWASLLPRPTLKWPPRCVGGMGGGGMPRPL